MVFYPDSLTDLLHAWSHFPVCVLGLCIHALGPLTQSPALKAIHTLIIAKCLFPVQASLLNSRPFHMHLLTPHLLWVSNGDVKGSKSKTTLQTPLPTQHTLTPNLLCSVFLPLGQGQFSPCRGSGQEPGSSP